jgi:hypothetical protein
MSLNDVKQNCITKCVVLKGMSKDMALVILMIDQLIVWVVTTAIGAMNNSSVRVFELLGELHVVCNLTRACPLSNGRQAGCYQGA